MKANQFSFTQFSSVYNTSQLLLKCACMLLLMIISGTSTSLYGQAASEASRGITLEEYAKAKSFTFKNLEEDTYVKFENAYILDRYQMKPPYVFKYSDGIERRFYLYKLLDNKTKKELGMVAVYYLPAEKKAINLCIPNATAGKDVWARYIDDLKELGAKENGLLSTYSYVLSKEMSALLSGGAGQAVSAAGTASDYDVCFAENALVLLLNGEEKPIQTIKPGDQIAAFDQATGKLVASTVEEVEIHEEKLYNLTSVMVFKEEISASTLSAKPAASITIEATGNHPVLTDKGRKSIDELKAGDQVYVYDQVSNNFATFKVMQVSSQVRKAPKVYNLVTTHKNYLVNRTVVLDK